MIIMTLLLVKPLSTLHTANFFAPEYNTHHFRKGSMKKDLTLGKYLSSSS